MGKTVIVAKDGPGFIVNRCNRPFGLEALRLLQEQIADVETIDRICRMEGGFRMGPFELMDLVGVDTGSGDLQELLRAELRRAALAPVDDRRAPGGGGPVRTQDRARLLRLLGRAAVSTARRTRRRWSGGAPGHGEGVVVISGESVIAEELRAAAGGAGYEVRPPHAPTGGVLPALFVDCEGDHRRRSN